MNRENPEGLQRIRDIFSGREPKPSMTRTVPIDLVEAEVGHVLLTARAGEDHLNSTGWVHGGFAATVLDTATGCVLRTMLDAETGMATVDLGVKMLSPVPRDTVLWSRAEVIKLTRRIGVSQASLEDGSGRIYAHATATYMIFR
jgi:uncharacterized protein (TIGR00369 family)